MQIHQALPPPHSYSALSLPAGPVERPVSNGFPFMVQVSDHKSSDKVFSIVLALACLFLWPSWSTESEISGRDCLDVPQMCFFPAHNWTTFPSLPCNLVRPLTEFWPAGCGWEQCVLLAGPENLLGDVLCGVSISFLSTMEAVCLKTLVKRQDRSLGCWIRAWRRATWSGKPALTKLYGPKQNCYFVKPLRV